MHKYRIKEGKRKIKEEKASAIDLYEKRIIYLDGEINDSLAQTIIEKLLKLDMQNHKDITLYINSRGGDVSSGLAIYDVMNMIKSDVSTICVGKSASMACILLINGAKGKRFILPNSEIMIHEVSSLSFGKITEMQENLRHSDILNNRLLRIIENKTKMSMNDIKKNTKKKDTWLNSHNALKYGFVDKILY